MKSCEEWSLGFDLSFDNIASGMAPGMNEYEKSVYLTRAEKDIVLALYKGQLGDSFEATEELTAYLESLVRQKKLLPLLETDSVQRLSDKSVLFANPSDLLFRTVEGCTISVNGSERVIPVIPVTRDEYWRTLRNPFKQPNINKSVRITSSTNGNDEADGYENSGVVEIIGKHPAKNYIVSYLAMPEPIILEDLTDGKTIDGKDKAQTCKLPEALHQSILAEAVRLAKAAWTE